MSSILAVVPRPVTITLGGARWRASEFRLGDLADLQSWLGDQTIDPFDAAAGRLRHGPRDREWKRLLADTIAARESHPPAFGGDSAARLLDSPAGTREQIRLGLRREHPDLTPADVAAIYGDVTVEEYDRFARIAWGLDPMGLMTAMVDGPPARDPAPPDWPATWHRYLTTVVGPAPRFADLTLTQFRAWANGGKLPDGTEVDARDWREKAAHRARFWAELDNPES